MYRKPMTCIHCGFVEVLTVGVSGDFDGWEAYDLRQKPSDCPFCQHAKKIGLVVPRQVGV